jgi:hypothetical protein
MSDGLAAADAFHDAALRAGLEIEGAGASDAGTGAGAASEVGPALTETDGGTMARSATAADGVALALRIEDDVETGGALTAMVVLDALAVSTLDASRTGTQRTLSAAIASRSSFSEYPLSVSSFKNMRWNLHLNTSLPSCRWNAP